MSKKSFITPAFEAATISDEEEATPASSQATKVANLATDDLESEEKEIEAAKHSFFEFINDLQRMLGSIIRSSIDCQLTPEQYSELCMLLDHLTATKGFFEKTSRNESTDVLLVQLSVAAHHIVSQLCCMSSEIENPGIPLTSFISKLEEQYPDVLNRLEQLDGELSSLKQAVYTRLLDALIK